MLTMATVRQINADTGEASLEAPRIMGDKPLPRVPIMPMLNGEGTPRVGDRVLLYYNNVDYRYFPITEQLSAEWRTATRYGVKSPAGDVAVILDDEDRTTRIGRASADQRVVHEGLQALLSDLWEKVGGIVQDQNVLFSTTPAYAAGVEAINSISDYTAEGVFVHAEKADAGGGAT